MTDNTNEVEDALNEAFASHRQAVFDARDYVVTRKIIVPPNAGLHVAGEHLYGTRFVWIGDDDCMFDRANSRDQFWANFTVDVEGDLGCVFRDANMNFPHGDVRRVESMLIPSSNVHRRLIINGNERLYCYRRYDVGNTDENNEAHRDESVRVANAQIGWLISGVHAKYQKMVDCRFDGGKCSMAAVHALHGSFSWLDGGGYGAQEAFFVIENQADTIALHRVDVDGSNKFLRCTGPLGQTGASQPIEIAGGRFMTHAMNASRVAIDFRTAGPLVVRNFQIGSGTQPIGRIDYAADHGALEVVGCMFGSHGSTRENSIRTSAGVTQHVTQNTYHKANGESYNA